MTDLKNGVLDINGFELTRDTKFSDIETLPSGTVDIRTSKRGNIYVYFREPVIADGVEMKVSVDFSASNNTPGITLSPVVCGQVPKDDVGSCKAALAACKKWLSAAINAPADRDDEDYIRYSFPGIVLSAMICDDRDYGQRFIPIEITFSER